MAIMTCHQIPGWSLAAMWVSGAIAGHGISTLVRLAWRRWR